jgi:hypothetical protein
MAYPPWEISLMVSTTGVADVIVVDIRYPESFAWGLSFTFSPKGEVWIWFLADMPLDNESQLYIKKK